MSTNDRLTPEGRKFEKKLEELDSLEVCIGFQSGKHFKELKNGKKVDVAEYAVYNELGTVNAPARPFLKKTVDDRKDSIEQFFEEQILPEILSEETAEQILNACGSYMKGQVQDEIRNGDFEPNAESTIRKKKSSQPLIDSGLMRESVDYIVRKKGED